MQALHPGRMEERKGWGSRDVHTDEHLSVRPRQTLHTLAVARELASHTSECEITVKTT